MRRNRFTTLMKKQGRETKYRTPQGLSLEQLLLMMATVWLVFAFFWFHPILGGSPFWNPFGLLQLNFGDPGARFSHC